ncbi:ABC transporter substrate-binding protein [Novosphingobium sp. Chol11]|uniref:ABC transporter substrate-binding protein n=1 Tax=Novosphingobium sp. Chol11 TaxID=1385763 RepID=UPI0025CE0D5B|nr:ABC transporter substrate-binding protein [Novosphingobium sp. Chol11]
MVQFVSRRLVLGSLLAASAAESAMPALAQSGDPSTQAVTAPVRQLNDGLLAIMKAGSTAGYAARLNRISPVVDATFDLPLMTRLVVGSVWTKTPATDQSAVAAAFRKMTAARYAASFKGYSGESFEIDPKVEARGPDRLVHTKLIRPRGTPVALDYRLRQSGGQWRIIDIYYQNSISQIATQRSDFARILATGGVKALTIHLTQLAATSAK